MVALLAPVQGLRQHRRTQLLYRNGMELFDWILTSRQLEQPLFSRQDRPAPSLRQDAEHTPDVPALAAAAERTRVKAGGRELPAVIDALNAAGLSRIPARGVERAG